MYGVLPENVCLTKREHVLSCYTRLDLLSVHVYIMRLCVNIMCVNVLNLSCNVVHCTWN